MSSNGGPARLLRVYGLWILLITAVVMGAGYWVSTFAPTVYQTGAIVVVAPRVPAIRTSYRPRWAPRRRSPIRVW